MASGLFYFATCQVGAEKALIAEIVRNHPELKMAFSRPGFVTFKSERAHEIKLRSIFARSSGISMDRADDEVQLVETATEWLAEKKWPRKPRLHVWERDRFMVGEEPKGFVRNVRASVVREKLLQTGLFESELTPLVGETVLDVIDVDENLWWLGHHVHSTETSAYPGGIPLIELPAKAPSRAYLKLREALIWSRLPIQKGDRAVELGSAPGGASWALLEDGLKVTGIDPAHMDPAVLDHPSFEHIQGPAHAVGASQVRGAQWFLMDVNIDPKQALEWAEILVSFVGESLLGVILTIKLNHWRFAEFAKQDIERVKKMGMVKVGARQLAHNKQEFCVYGLTEAGLKRLNSKKV